MITRYKAADPLDPTSQAEYKVLAAGAQRYWHGTRAAFEQVKNSIPNNTMICITDDNDAPSDNAPIGSVFAYYGSTSPDGYLICDGSTFDTSLYPDLYLFLGSDTLPDLRECTLVGVGQNTTHTIADHDEYTLGQFKDDQSQRIRGGAYTGATYNPSGVTTEDNAFVRDASWGSVGGSGGTWYQMQFDSARSVRAGTTTHGKQVGVNYIIKATSNMSKSDASALLAQVIQHMTLDYSNIETITALPYTATKRGVLLLDIGSQSGNGGRTFYINGTKVGTFGASGSTTYVITTLNFPVDKGDILTSSGGIWGTYSFVPYK